MTTFAPHPTHIVPSTQAAVCLTEVSKTYGRGEDTVRALDRVTTAFRSGTFTAVMGPSGSGKSTLLHVAAGLDRPSSGVVQVGGLDVTQLSATKLTELRRSEIGFVFQAFNLLPALTVKQNIALPGRLAGTRTDKVWADTVVRRVGLSDRLRHRPAELSGGQQQRVAIARALVMRPRVLFADEPTGALDSRTGREILTLLRESVDELGQTIVMVTHDPVAATFADSVILLADGRIVDELVHPTPAAIVEQLNRIGA